MAQRVQDLQAFSTDASDSALWDRLRRELADWAHSRVIHPVTIDRLEKISMDLDPQESRTKAQREQARRELRFRLIGLYRVLISSDPLTRSIRENREALRIKPRPWLWRLGLTLWQTDNDASPSSELPSSPRSELPPGPAPGSPPVDSS
jgi:hypothetical protein